MMLTDLQIANNALGRLGCERISSLEDNSKRARLVNDFLASSKKVTLEMGPWDFATKRETLTATGVPAFEYTHSFCKPDNLIFIVKEYNDEEYKVEGSDILANAQKLLLIYVYDIDEKVKRTPNFDKAWYLNLASEMAYSLTQNNSLKDSLMAEAELLAPRAMSYNAKGSTPTEYTIDTFINTRL